MQITDSPAEHGPRKNRIGLYLFTAIALSVLVYLPGLHGPFVFDDLHNITQNSALALDSLSLDGLVAAATSGDAGPTGRPLAMVSFGLSYWMGSGYSPQAFKALNIAIHAVNTGLLFLLLSTFSRFAGIHAPRYSILLITAAWAVHPINLTSVLYVVQRMNSMSALITLGTLIGYFQVLTAPRISPGQRSLRALLILAAGTGLSMLCKENGVLTPIYALVMEVYGRKHADTSTSQSEKPTSYRARTKVLYLLLFALFSYLGYLGLREHAYSNRAFSLTERLLTESRILWSYVFDIVAPTLTSPHFYQDDITKSSGLLTPWTTVTAIFAWAVVFVVTIKATAPRSRLVAACILWFMAGHLLESTLVPLELAFDHRNYLPSVAILVLVAAGIHTLGQHSTGLSKLAPVFSIALVLGWAALTAHRSWMWRDELSFVQHQLATSPNSPRTQHLAGNTLESLAKQQPANSDQLLRSAATAYRRAAKLDPDNAGSLLKLLVALSQGGQTYPIEIESALLQRLEFARALPVNGNTLANVLQSEALYARLDPNLLFKAAEAFQRNTRAPDHQKLQVAIALAQYSYNHLASYKDAMNILDNAAAYSLGHEAQLYVTKALLMAASGKGDARSELERAKRYDLTNRFHSEYRHIERQLSNQPE